MLETLHRRHRRGSVARMTPFISALRVAFAVGVGFSAIGAVVSAMRGGHRTDDMGQAAG